MLEIFKFLGYGVAAAATIWGIVSKQHYEDAEGTHRVTGAGHVAVALAIAGFLLGSGAIGFELSIEATAKAQAASERAERREAAREQRLSNLADRDRDQRLALQEALNSFRIMSRADQIHTNQLLAGLRAIEFERSVRVRDSLLARQVSEGTRSTLTRTGLALGQLERLLQPLGPISVEVVWELSLDTPTLRRLFEPVDRLGRAVIAARRGTDDVPTPSDLLRDGCLWETAAYWSRSGLEEAVRLRYVCVDDSFTFNYPLLGASLPVRTEIQFDVDRRPPVSLARVTFDELVSRTFPNSLGEIDIAVPPRGELSDVVYYPTQKIVRFVQSAEAHTPRPNRITSIPDLERSTVLMSLWFQMVGAESATHQVDPEVLRRIRPHLVVVRVQGREYHISGDQFRYVGRAIYYAESIGQPL